MPKTDFYLAATALIPILIFVDLAAQAVQVPVKFRNVDSAKRVFDFGTRMIRFTLLFWLGWWVFYGWAEWICLRSLETGHSATGGPTVIWIALALLGIQAITTGLKPVVSIQGKRLSEPED